MTTDTLTLSAFLLARIAEDEAAAQAATPGPWYWAPPSSASWPQGDQSLNSRIRNEGEDFDPSVLYGWGYDASGIEARDEDRAHIARHDPARVLAECARDRRIVELHLPTTSHRWCVSCTDIDTPPPNNMVAYPCPTLRALASAYADHPDYREEWRA